MATLHCVGGSRRNLSGIKEPALKRRARAASHRSRHDKGNKQKSFHGYRESVNGETELVRARLGASVRLRERRECDIALGHGLKSASKYSGSSSP